MLGKSQKIVTSILVTFVLVAGAYAFRDVICPPISAAIEQCSRQGKTVLNRVLPEKNSAPEALTPITELGPRYYTYSPEALERAHQVSNTVILYFWAPWCTTCSSLDLEIEENPDIIPAEAVVLRIPYDSATELKRRYQVTTQHTFVLLDEQNERVKLWVGGAPADGLPQK